MERKLLELIKSSDNILITSHISPDIDAVCSALLMLNILKANFSNKTSNLTLEERPNKDLSFLSGYGEIKFEDLANFIDNSKPQLLIIVDANKLSRCARLETDKLRQTMDQNGIKMAVIDHHEPADKDPTDVYINNGYPAAVEEIYHLFFEQLKLDKPSGYGEITMLGLLSDTLRFKYKNPKHRETLALVSDLVDTGVDIETLENKLETYTSQQLEVVAHLINNLNVGKNFNHSFISDEFIREWESSGKPLNELKNGVDIFVNQIIRNVQPNKWGFIVCRELIPSGKEYSASFRAESDSKDVSVLAKALGGGGHRPAAGAKFQAESVQEAINKVLTVVENGSVS